MSRSSTVQVTVFPARAGMILAFPAGQKSPDGIPRESGDDPVAEKLQGDFEAYSPRERG